MSKLIQERKMIVLMQPLCSHVFDLMHASAAPTLIACLQKRKEPPPHFQTAIAHCRFTFRSHGAFPPALQRKIRNNPRPI